jgi:hypothetical protein
LPLHAASASTASPTTASLNLLCMIEVVLFLKVYEREYICHEKSPLE